MPRSLSNPGVTVIVVAYNHALYLPELLLSIERLEESPSLVVLCDDNSTDASATVLQDWAQRTLLETVLILNDRNRGLTPTLNSALEKVGTPYFAYISGDDVMTPSRLGEQIALLERTGAAMAYSDASVIGADGSSSEPNFIERHLGPGTAPVDSFETLLQIGNWIPAPSVLLRTEVVTQLGGYDDSLFFEDYDLWLRIARRHAIVHSPRCMVKFRELETSLGSSKFADDNDDWQWAKVLIRAKHFGAGRSTDHVIADVIHPWLVNLAARGHNRGTLAKLFRRSAVASRSPRSLIWALIATVPGPLLRRVAGRRRPTSA